MTDDEADRVRDALWRYRDGQVGRRGAAVLAGLSIGEMMAEANERGVVSNYDETELADDVDTLRRESRTDDAAD